MGARFWRGASLLDISGGRRVDIGSYATVSAAKGACELHAAALCCRDREERGPVKLDIACAAAINR